MMEGLVLRAALLKCVVCIVVFINTGQPAVLTPTKRQPLATLILIYLAIFRSNNEKDPKTLDIFDYNKCKRTSQPIRLNNRATLFHDKAQL